MSRGAAAVRAEFCRCNDAALSPMPANARLKLAGLDEAPVHLALLADRGTAQGHGLGRRAMPEMAEYPPSWRLTLFGSGRALKALSLGWVSILDPVAVSRILEVPGDWIFLGYFCLGYPQSETVTPELAREGWEQRRPWEEFVLRR